MAIKFFNDVAVDSDVLYVDTISNRVGIGTTDPSAKLQVSSNSTNNTSVSIDKTLASPFATTLEEMIYGKGVIDLITIDTSPSFSDLYGITKSSTTNSEVFQAYYYESPADDGGTLSTRALSLNPLGGNVGIGTTSPTYKLHVVGNSYIDATSSAPTLTLGRYTGQPSIKGGTDDGGYLIMDSSGGNAALNWYSSDNVILANGGGNVGIGTSFTDAFTMLTIESPVRNGFGMLCKTAGVNNESGFYHDTSSVFSMRLRNGSGAQTVLVTSAGNTYLNGGNVGINTTSPTEKLTVSGNAYITNNMYVGSGNTLKSCTYPAQYGLMVGQSNTLGGISNGIIGIGNTIDCTAAPWDLFGGNFIAGKNNTINNQYSHANAVFGQNNTLGNSGDVSNNIANSLIAGSEHTLFSNNALVYGLSCFASSANHSLTGGYDSNNFASYGSVAIGSGATASAGLGQYALGTGITTPTTVSAAYGPDQFVVGKFNEYTNASSVPHRFAVGNGVSDASRSTPLCVIGSGTYTNGQVSIQDADGFAYTTVPYSVFHVNGRATSSYSSTFTVTSDERLKDNILDYDKGLAEILQVKPKSYTFNGKANTVKGVESIGVLAQEIKDVFPETIGTVNKRLNPTDEEETELYTVDISPVTYALINAIKELNAKIEALENRIQILEGN